MEMSSDNICIIAEKYQDEGGYGMFWVVMFFLLNLRSTNRMYYLLIIG